MNSSIYNSSAKIAKEYLDLVNNFPIEVEISWEDMPDILSSRIDNGNTSGLSNQQIKYARRAEEVLKRQGQFFENYSYNDLVLLFTAYEYGKLLYTSGENYLAEIFKTAGGQEKYFDSFFADIKHDVSHMTKDQLIYEITGKQDWIVKESLTNHLNA